MGLWNLLAKSVEQHGDITAATTPEDRPKFERIYEVRLDERAKMTITMENRYYSAGRDAYGELTQPNGRWVLFDPENVADKILDPALLPIIERRFAEIKALDREWLGNGPSAFKDEAGQKWVRA